MFINCKKALEFQNPETGEVIRFPRSYIGFVPDWVVKHWLFQAAVKDATITYVGDTPATPVAASSEEPPEGSGQENPGGSKTSSSDPPAKGAKK